MSYATRGSVRQLFLAAHPELWRRDSDADYLASLPYDLVSTPYHVNIRVMEMDARSSRYVGCGCTHGERNQKGAMHTHGHCRNGHRTPTYITWDSMIARCHRETHPRFLDYGGRGIIVCDDWRGVGGFIAFLASAGERPAGLTIDRIDVDGNYEPGNVRWATLKEQRWNRRDMAMRISENQMYADMGMSPTF